MIRRLLLSTLLLCTVASLHADANEDWAAIVALDAGPSAKPTSLDEARSFARAHLARQQKALEAFLLKYPRDPHAFDARKRLAATWAAAGRFDDNPAETDKAVTLLSELEKSPTATPAQQADAAFLRASIEMQISRSDPAAAREAVVRIAQNFADRYPTDRRGPRLLVEAATLCDDVPSQKQALLERALRETTEAPLKQRIQDDFKRLSQLGRPLQLRFTSANGGEVDLADLKGNVVVVIFWATEAPQSLLWLRDFRIAWEKMPQDGVKVVTINLDSDRPAMATKLRELPSSWPAYFDGKGWEGPVPRTLGINALPSVWILDKKGIVRTINARTDYNSWIKRLLAE